MEKEIIVGNSVFIMRAVGANNVKICKKFCEIIPKIEKRLVLLLKKYELPEEIMLNFKTGDESLDGFYHVQSKKVSRNIVAIDVFTKQMKWMQKKESSDEIEINLVDTLIHELIHNKIQNESQTRKIVTAYIKKNKISILKELRK